MKLDPNSMTCTVPGAVKEPTLDDMLAAFDQIMAVPEPIGTLHGAVVYLRHDKRELSWDGMPGVSVDHPYLQGTKIRTSALERLGEKPNT